MLARKEDVVAVNFFLTSTTVFLDHFAEASQIQTYDFVRELQKNFTTC